MRSIIVACSLALAGCASMNAEDCRSTDWYNLGARDGFTGGPSLIDRYTAQCSAHGVRPDAARYAEGAKDGQLQRQRARSGHP